ncbi:MAG: right-handed parallel beta-helix repeat-containing protein [Chitinispirillaceae bacterium]|nr:right-handed parallel beta-helix repeat-containing protein [Chitinispirillaceae bacterium]
MGKRYFFQIVRLFLMIISITVFATSAVYYVNNNGNDALDGKTEQSALKTLSKAASNAKRGDTIYLRKGDIFRENVSLPEGVVVKAYGDGIEKPLICGSERITKWTKENKGNIFSASVEHKIYSLYVNGKIMKIARYPNIGYLFTTKNNENSTVVTCEELRNHPKNSDNYWKGCRMRWRHWSWYYDTRLISSYKSDGTMQLEGKPSNESGNGASGWGFYLDGKAEELDTAGEWYYDESSKRVYLLPPTEVEDLSQAIVEGVWREKGISISNSVIEGISFRYFNSNGLEVTRNSKIYDCEFEGIGGDSGGAALSITWDAVNITVSKCTFKNCLNLAISWIQNTSTKENSYIINNKFVNIGYIPGYGGNGPWHAAGIIVYAGRNVHIEENIFDTIGYAAVILGSAGNFVEKNIITNAMWTLNDGAGIYTNCDSSTIRYNIVLYSNGGWESTGWEIRLAHGIWPEFLEHFKNNIIEFNTCAYNNGNGIFFPNNFNSLVRYNTCYGNLSDAQIHIEGGFYTDDNLPLNDTIYGNIFFATRKDAYALTYRPEYNYGLISNNYYCNPFSENVIGEYEKGGWNVRARTLSWWRENWSQADREAKTDIIKRKESANEKDYRGTSKLLINYGNTQQFVSTGDNGIYLSLDGDTVKRGIELPPYSSKVLVHSGLYLSTNMRYKTNSYRHNFFVNIAKTPYFLLTIEDRADVNISIIDIKGRLKWGSNKKYVSGKHIIKTSEVKWAKGIYFCKYSIYGENGIKREGVEKIVIAK